MSIFAVAGSDGSYQLTQAGYVLIIAVIIAALLLICVIRKPDQRGTLGTRKLVFSAMAIALATVASMIKLFHLPMGGSITFFSMLLVSLVGYWYGLGTGLFAGLAYGLLQLIIDPYIISLPQMLVDYVFAFTALGLSGVFSGAKHGLIKGYLLGVVGRYFFAVLSGYIFFGSYSSEYGMSAMAYSLAYNGIYIFTECGLTIVLLLIPAVNKAMTKVKNMAVEGPGHGRALKQS
ncbi:MAG: energy-coupled thiamine transporter ThiT [Bilifractor sp.]|nr:energy-coupled thiamine transporter ThiT [Lachnospiraceae bacterium]MDY2838234.1 energy-coupled thiamine transporter ThiT [Bilifractor sp.]